MDAMKSLWPVLCVLAAVCAVPYFVLGVRRLKMAVKLRRACRAEGHRLVPLHPFWLWGSRSSAHADFLVRIRGGRAVYTVKLFSTAHRLANLYFVKTADGQLTYFERRVVPLAGRFPTMLDDDLRPIPGGSVSGVNYVYDTRRRTRHEVDYASPTEGEHITNIPVLLVNPAPLAVRASEEIPAEHWTVERQPMFTKKEPTRLESRTVYDGELLHLAEYVYGTSGFIKELTDLKLLRDYGVFAE